MWPSQEFRWDKETYQAVQYLIGDLLQGPQPVAGQVKYRSTFGTMAIVAREEGFAALYKGLVPKVMRLGPGGAIMLVVFEYAFNYLDQRFG